MRAAPAGIALLLLHACSTTRPGPSPAAPAEGLRLRVEVVFEPPLDAPTTLLVEHEAAVAFRVEAARSGVTLGLPPGPVVMRLAIDGGFDERALVVAPAGSVYVWRR